MKCSIIMGAYVNLWNIIINLFTESNTPHSPPHPHQSFLSFILDRFCYIIKFTNNSFCNVLYGANFIQWNFYFRYFIFISRYSTGFFSNVRFLSLYVYVFFFALKHIENIRKQMFWCSFLLISSLSLLSMYLLTSILIVNHIFLDPSYVYSSPLIYLHWEDLC